MKRRNFIASAITTGIGLLCSRLMANSLAQEPKDHIAPEEVTISKGGLPDASDRDFKVFEYNGKKFLYYKGIDDTADRFQLDFYTGLYLK